MSIAEMTNLELGRKTARTYLAASIFLEVMKVFGDLETEVRKPPCSHSLGLKLTILPFYFSSVTCL
jgi:hypothetical protein